MNERDDPEDKDLAALYRAASTEEPAAGLDARILAAARASAVPRASRPSFAARWRIPFALAASVVLATSLTVLVREQKDDPSRLGAPAERVQAPPAPANAPDTPVVPIAPPTPAPVVAPPAPTTTNATAKTARPPVAQPHAATREAPATEDAARDARSAAASSGSLAAERKAMQAAPEAPRAAPAPQRADRLERAAGAAPAAAGAAAEAVVRSPEQWLEEIRNLRREGHMAEAEASLDAFRKRYPDYRLPDDLKTP